MKTYFEDVHLRLNIPIENVMERITVYGFIGVHVEGHKGLLEYSCNKIAIRINCKKIFILGECLSIKEISQDEIFVSGKIKGIETSNE